ncbi:hypothetical protein IJG28_02770 [Candidatus Saccharibacteria bacterium]|nr:hypothetical protein [Candidatus Saccharibacteria bacterium]
MKKLAIASASVALAAMPVVGVFAVTGSTEFTDNLSVTVNSGCTLENGGNTDGTYVDRSFSKNIAVGNSAVLDGSAATDTAAITIKCNTTSGTVTVTSAGSTTLVGTSSADNTIATGAATSGSTSNWAIKSNASNTSSDPYAAYKAHVPGTFLTATASASGTTFNPSYQVYVAQGQAPDTYTGSVTYTVSYTSGS